MAADLDPGYLPTVDPVVEGGPGTGLRQPISSYLQTKGASLLGAALYFMASQVVPGTMATSRRGILLVSSNSPRPMPCNSFSERKHYYYYYFGNSCIICVLGGPGPKRNGSSKTGRCPTTSVRDRCRNLESSFLALLCLAVGPLGVADIKYLQ